MQTFASQRLNEDSDIMTTVEEVSAARTYVSAMNEIQTRRKRLMWDGLARLLATQIFPGHAVGFLMGCFKDPSPFDMERHVTFVRWSKKWQWLL